jgi:hypothetical protein
MPKLSSRVKRQSTRIESHAKPFGQAPHAGIQIQIDELQAHGYVIAVWPIGYTVEKDGKLRWFAGSSEPLPLTAWWDQAMLKCYSEIERRNYVNSVAGRNSENEVVPLFPSRLQRRRKR